MNGNGASAPGLAAELRRAFDQSFADAPQTETRDVVEILSVQVSGEAYGLRLSQIRGLYPAGKIAPLRGPVPELLGLAALRSKIVPVYALGGLLGHPSRQTPQWLVFTGAGEECVALALDRLDAHIRVAVSDISTDAGPNPGRPHVRSAARVGERTLPLVDVPSVLEQIRREIGAHTSREE